MFGRNKDVKEFVREVFAEKKTMVMPRNEVIFEGKIVAPINETTRTEGLFTMKIEGQVNGSACTIPVFVKNVDLADALFCKEKYSMVSLFGHLEYPMWQVRNGKGFKSRLIFVADDFVR